MPGNPWWVYYNPPGEDRIPADGAHAALVDLVNAIKQAEGGALGGGFSINEYQQVIARMPAPAGYRGNAVEVIGMDDGEVITYSEEVITFSGGRLDPRDNPGEGAAWTGPLCGTTYSFTAPGNPQPPSRNLDEVIITIEGANLQLSGDARISPYPPARGALTNFLAALRRQLPEGGRFRVNEHRRAFTSAGSIFIGTVPANHWFRQLQPTINC